MNTQLVKLLAVVGVVVSLTACNKFEDQLAASKHVERTEPVSTAGAEVPNFLVGTASGYKSEFVKFNRDPNQVLQHWKQNGYDTPIAWEEYTPNGIISVAVEPKFEFGAGGKYWVSGVEVHRLVAPTTYQMDGAVVTATINTPTGCVITEEYVRTGANTANKTILGYTGSCSSEQAGALDRGIARGPKAIELVAIQ